MSSQPTSTTRCRRNSHRPTATTPPTTVSPPKGAPRSRGRARNSTKPWRNPDRQAAVNAAPTAASATGHPSAADHPEAPRQRHRERGQHRVEADRDPAEGGERPAVPGQVGHHRDGEQQRVQQHGRRDQDGQRRQPATPAGHPLAAVAEPEQRAPQTLAVEGHREEREQSAQHAEAHPGLHQPRDGVRRPQLGREQLGQPVAQLGHALRGGEAGGQPEGQHQQRDDGDPGVERQPRRDQGEVPSLEPAAHAGQQSGNRRRPGRAGGGAVDGHRRPCHQAPGPAARRAREGDQPSSRWRAAA